MSQVSKIFDGNAVLSRSIIGGGIVLVPFPAFVPLFPAYVPLFLALVPLILAFLPLILALVPSFPAFFVVIPGPDRESPTRKSTIKSFFQYYGQKKFFN